MWQGGMVPGARTRGLVKKNPWTGAELASRDTIRHHGEHCPSPRLHSAEPNTAATCDKVVFLPIDVAPPSKIQQERCALREAHPDPVDGLGCASPLGQRAHDSGVTGKVPGSVCRGDWMKAAWDSPLSSRASKTEKHVITHASLSCPPSLPLLLHEIIVLLIFNLLFFSLTNMSLASVCKDLLNFF